MRGEALPNTTVYSRLLLPESPTTSVVFPAGKPLPPAPDSGSIFKSQKTGGAKSVFTMA